MKSINTFICLRQIVQETIGVGTETAAALKAQVSQLVEFIVRVQMEPQSVI